MPTLMPLYGQTPGITALSQETPKIVHWGQPHSIFHAPQNQIVSTATDASNTPTTTLRAGMVLARITSSGKWTTCDPNAAGTGAEVPAGILLTDTPMLGASGSVEDKLGIPIALRAFLKAADILVEGTVLTSSTDEFYVRQRLMARGFLFDDDFDQKLYAPVLHGREKVVTGDTTVTAADNGTLFIVSGSSGATIFTLPTFEAGLTFEFLQLDDQNMTIASASSSDNIVGKNDVAADSIAFSTMSEKLGAHVRLRSLEVSAKWMTDLLCSCTATMA